MSSTGDLDVRVVTDETERKDAFAVRHEVFVEEQGVDEDLEYDEHDADAVHFVAYDDAEPVGVARLRELEDDDAGKVERVAVLESRRGEGIGWELMRTLEERATELGLAKLKLHSQTHAAEFYDRLGYDRYGEEFEEAGIPHVEMRKSLE
ncbi:GNAT family N-acetyltransferase [Natronobacterium gregoryi]|uniref:Acyltransferase n=2 Tax=Natronobacterium gregoryi TaxID=44930 RepID=L0AGQ6_NATGS|nr:GNAT family N-acetyltransferase [Natronobacterium gregoryi]AFZ72342.1 putative acyltransferase [Natronobacterium gregoryi SP2]ELY64272.1 GCN5-related N-acetyltransferase [Natronobacterium gregoryi SP2]PLK20341.1 GNAT family N-acetyltransferase [Natronobacterium gregoryi SP2]SFJ23079.1 Predicted N-acyltransferase, GNAT family [Natronobacterium gregoryi]